MSDTLVSVILPCYNAHRFLPEALASVAAQTHPHIETIIIDDGSTDPVTHAYLDTLPPSIRVVKQENRGLPGARNRGFSEAKGQYVLPLDCDDWLEPDAVARMLAVLEAAPPPAFAFAQMQMEGDGKGVLTKNYNHFEQLFLNQLPYCLLIPHAVWVDAGGYDESMRKGYEDWEFNIRIGLRGCHGVCVHAPLFHYRIAQQGMLLSTSNKVHAQLWSAIRRKHYQAYRWASLYRTWLAWRGKPSTYPLWSYFFWLAVARLLPDTSFSALFKLLRSWSHSRRVTAGNPDS